MGCRASHSPGWLLWLLSIVFSLTICTGLGPSAVRYHPENSEQGRYARKRRSFARRMLARSALSVLLIQSFVIQPFATRQACGSGRIFFCCHACSFSFSPGRRACQPPPNLNENRTTQFCRLMQLTSFMTSLFYFAHLFSPCKGYPGEGPMQIATLNVTSLPKRLDTVLNFANSCPDLGCLILQETRIPASRVNSLTLRARNAGWDLLVGHQPPIRAIKSDKASLRQSWGGLAALVPRDHPARLLSFQSGWSHLERVCMPLWIPSDDGRSGFVVLNCYLPSGQSVIDERETLLSDIFSFASIFDTSPTVVGGDLQCAPEDSSALTQVLASNRWSDFYADCCRSRNLEPEATYSGNGWASGFRGLRKTRIDHLFLNDLARSAAKEASIFRGPVAPGHCPVVIRLECQVFHEMVFGLKQHPQWNLPPKPCSQEEWDERDAICHPILTKYIPSFVRAAEEGDPQTLWDSLTRMMHEMLNCITGQFTQSRRGDIPVFEQKPFLPPPCKQNQYQQVSLKIRKQLHELSKKNQQRHEDNPVWMTHLKRTLINTSKGLGTLGCTVPTQGFSQQQVTEFLSAANQALTTCDLDKQMQDSTKAIHEWKDRLRISNSADKREVFRWLKGVTPSHPKTLVRPDGSLTGSPNEILSLLKDHAEKIYNHHRNTNEDALFAQFVNMFQDEINSLKNPTELPPFDAVNMWKLFQKNPPIKPRVWMDGRLRKFKYCHRAHGRPSSFSSLLLKLVGSGPNHFIWFPLLPSPKPMNGPLNLPGPLELRQFSIPSGHLSASNNWRHGWEIWPPLHSRADCPIDRLPLQKSNYLATCLIRTKPLTTLLSLYLLIVGNVSTCCCQNFVFNSDPL